MSRSVSATQGSATGVDEPSVRLRELPRLIRGAFGLVWQAARREFVACSGLQLLAGVALAVQLLVGRRLLTVLLAGTSHDRLSRAIGDIVALTAALAVASVSNLARYEVGRLLSELVARYATEQVTSTAAAAPLEDFEEPAHYDRLLRALVNASSRPLQLATGVIALIGSLTSSLAIAVALFEIQPILCLFAVVAVVPFFLANVVAGRSLYRFTFQQTARDRRRLYLQTILTHRDAAKEIRAYGLAEPFRDRHRELYRQRVHDLRLVVRQRLVRGGLSSLATALLAGASVLVLVLLLDDGRLSVASAATAGGALLLLGGQLQTLSSGVGSLYESALFIRDFRAFTVTAVEVSGRPVAPAFEELVADGLSFTYPSGERPVLTGVSVRIKAGQVVALVGENGSGKSTLSKLLAGLYEPTAGELTWAGKGYADWDPVSLRSHIAVLFQDFVHYQLSGTENIALGQWEVFDEKAVRAAAETVQADEFLDELPEGFDTQLGPEFFGGVDLSGGQWQRVAFARALYRNASLVILDEPTASLDARSEAALYGAMRRLFAGRAVLLTSHRFASARLADHIYVLERGRVVEEGCHDDLVAAGGLYAELFALQAASFVD